MNWLRSFSMETKKSLENFSHDLQRKWRYPAQSNLEIRGQWLTDAIDKLILLFLHMMRRADHLPSTMDSIFCSRPPTRAFGRFLTLVKVMTLFLFDLTLGVVIPKQLGGSKITLLA